MISHFPTIPSLHDANFRCSFGSAVHSIGPHILTDLLLFNLNTPTVNGFQECASSAKQLFLLILKFLPLYELFSGFYVCCHLNRHSTVNCTSYSHTQATEIGLEIIVLH